MLSRSHERVIALVFITASALLLHTGCMPPGVVVNHERFETVLTTMKLGDYPALKLYFGGSLMEILLKDVKLVTIDPSESLQYGNELFYSAEISLKDGRSIISTEQDKTNRTKVFISIQNTLIGKQGNDKFRISLGNVARLEVRQ